MYAVIQGSAAGVGFAVWELCYGIRLFDAFGKLMFEDASSVRMRGLEAFGMYVQRLCVSGCLSVSLCACVVASLSSLFVELCDHHPLVRGSASPRASV